MTWRNVHSGYPDRPSRVDTSDLGLCRLNSLDPDQVKQNYLNQPPGPDKSVILC